jgi:hypothetical protein
MQGPANLFWRVLECSFAKSRDILLKAIRCTEKVRKIGMDLWAKTDKIMKKYRVKMIEGWVAMPEHLQVLVFDASNIEAVIRSRDGTRNDGLAELQHN